jgi:hypothetical protein
MKSAFNTGLQLLLAIIFLGLALIAAKGAYAQGGNRFGNPVYMDNVPHYSTGTFQPMVWNNTTHRLERTTYPFCADTINAPFVVIDNGSSTDLIVSSPTWKDYCYMGIDGLYGIAAIQDSTGNLGTYIWGPNMYINNTINQPSYISYQGTGNIIYEYGTGSAGEGYLGLEDTNNVKQLWFDAADGITSADTLFLNAKYFSLEGVSGVKALSGDSTGVNIGNLRLTNLNYAAIDTLSGSVSLVTRKSAPHYINATSSVTITFGNSYLVKGDMFTFKTVIGSGTVTFQAVSGSVEGAVSYTMTGAKKYVTLQYDGTNFWVLANN